MGILYFVNTMDTRFWGPSAWQLFHLVAFTSKHPDDVLNQMKDVLPCKYCRASTTEFVHKHPLRGDPGRWLYEIHNMVNDKLRTQCKEDPAVVDPGPDPAFEAVKAHYMSLKPNAVPGADFLGSIAANYPDDPEPEQMATQRTFLHALHHAYPFPELRVVYSDYITAQEPELRSRKAYMKWMYGLLRALSKKARVYIRSFKGWAHHLAYFKSGCSKKTYHGKTCRKTAGGRTKDRDHRRTFRIVHGRLL
jgi:hypothetical protein